MQRLAQFDISRQFRTPTSQRAAQYVFGTVCAGAMIGLRATIDMIAPTAGPFALIYPTVLLATFYGHLRAGFTALLLTFFWAWYFVLPSEGSFAFVNPSDPARVALNAASCIIVIVFAEAFRRAAHSTLAQATRAADRRLTLLAELEHRTKNNFTLVASMLEIQRRRLPDPSSRLYLDDAANRVRTFAEAYSFLADEQSESSDVDMHPYLNVVLERLERAALPPHVRMFREIEPHVLPRETAVAIGLYLNEAVSNCLKYAFPSERPGTIAIFFNAAPDGSWRLSVEDDGVGAMAKSDALGGLGSSLMAAFARQAGAHHEAGPGERGFRASLSQSASEAAVSA